MDSEDAGQIAGSHTRGQTIDSLLLVCNNLTDVDPCQYCSLPTRSDKTLCIVEESTNILSVEKLTLQWPLSRVMDRFSAERESTDQLTITSLLRRLENGLVEEVIVATNPKCRRRNHRLYLRA